MAQPLKRENREYNPKAHGAMGFKILNLYENIGPQKRRRGSKF